jgi:hypothetical protein
MERHVTTRNADTAQLDMGDLSRGPPLTRLPSERRSSIVAGSAWMVLISLALFFVPLLNGFVGGLVGGYKVGTVGRGLTAAVLPAGVVAVGLWVLLALAELPLLGMLAGVAIGLAVVFSELGLFLGAMVGGLLASNRPPVERKVIV